MEKKLSDMNKLKLLKLAYEALCSLRKMNELKEQKRPCSVREINRDRNRNGFFVQTFLWMKDIDHQQFFIYTRMASNVYKLLLSLITPFLQKNSLREPVQPECRLAATLL